MKVPTKFNLLYKTITVDFSDTLLDREDCMGVAHYMLNKIQLQSGMSKDDTEVTFIHELIHYVLQVMGEKELNNNEKFVELFGFLLYQALSSAEYK